MTALPNPGLPDRLIELSRGRHRGSMPVLSLGCQSGADLIKLRQAGFLVAGAAESDSARLQLKQRLAGLGWPRSDLRDGPLTRLAWPDQFFEFVIAEDARSFWQGDESGLVAREALRVLRSDGLLLVDLESAHEEQRKILSKTLSAIGFDVETRRADQTDNLGTESFTTHDALIARKRTFTEVFKAAFQHRQTIPVEYSDPCAAIDLGRQVRAMLPALGYQQGKGRSDVLLVPRQKYEDRLLPLLILDRRGDSAPLIQYDFQGGLIRLRLFGPPQSDRTSPYVQFDIDCVSQLAPIDPRLVESGVHAVYRGVAIGVHATERLLRTADLQHHGSTDLPEEVAGMLETLIAQAITRCDLLQILFTSIGSFTNFAGHDCYDEAVDVNFALKFGAPVLVQPKGKVFQYYEAESAPGEWSADADVFISHLGHCFRKEIVERWESVDPAFVADACSLMDQRMASLSALPYMRNVWFRDRDSSTSTGWRNFRDALGVPVYEPGRPEDSGRVVWVLSLHSFADEPFRWGLDRLWSLYDMFLVAARHIRAVGPSDLIVLRPHPNSLALFLDQNIVDQVHSGIVRGPTELLDIYLQLRLCQAISQLGLDCELSSLQPTGELLQPKSSVVITRHGSIVAEAAWMQRIGIFSTISPYAFLFGKERQYSNTASLREAITLNREQALAATSTFPSRDDIARYQAILDTTRGVKRARVMGEIPWPTLKQRPMRNIDDFAYGVESVTEAAERLLSCLNAPVEKAAMQRALGRI